MSLLQAAGDQPGFVAAEQVRVCQREFPGHIVGSKWQAGVHGQSQVHSVEQARELSSARMCQPSVLNRLCKMMLPEIKRPNDCNAWQLVSAGS